MNVQFALLFEPADPFHPFIFVYDKNEMSVVEAHSFVDALIGSDVYVDAHSILLEKSDHIEVEKEFKKFCSEVCL